MRAGPSDGDFDADWTDGRSDRAEHVLQGSDNHRVGTDSPWIRRRHHAALAQPDAGKRRVDVEAEPTLGDVVCDSRVDGNWRSVLRQSAEGAERSYAAG
jgi:hypothetical protein